MRGKTCGCYPGIESELNSIRKLMPWDSTIAPQPRQTVCPDQVTAACRLTSGQITGMRFRPDVHAPKRDGIPTTGDFPDVIQTIRFCTRCGIAHRLRQHEHRPGTGSSRNSLIAVAYGTVQNVQQVQMKPNYAEGSLIGGALGRWQPAATLRQPGPRTAAGAGLGPGFKETAGTANQYTIMLVNGNTVSVVTDQKEIDGRLRVGRTGDHTNIRRVSAAMCNTPPPIRPTPI